LSVISHTKTENTYVYLFLENIEKKAKRIKITLL